MDREEKSSSIFHYHTVKPFDKETLIDYASKTSTIGVIEEHTKSGGLGEMIGYLLLKRGLEGTKFKTLAIPDIYPDSYGTQNSTLDKYNINTRGILTFLQEK